MNRIFRVVWSHARQAFVVAHEHAAARGKPSTSSKPLGLAVATALLALSGGAASAADICTTAGTTTYSGSTTADNCLLASGEGLLNTGTINRAGASNLTVIEAAAGSLGISNTGTISTQPGANNLTAIANTGSVGGINNGSSGLIFGGSNAIITGANSALPFVRNQGQIDSDQIGILTTGAVGGNAVFGDLTNSGTIVGEGVSNSHGVSVENGATFSGVILNEATGIIRGGNSGIQLRSNTNQSTLNGSIVNAGVITASTAAGTALRFLNAPGTMDVTNTGTIAGGSAGYGILLAAALTGGITTSGTISGGLASIDNFSSGTATGGIRILGNNTAKFIGPVNAAGVTVKVDSGVIYTMDNGQLFSLGSATFTNAGTVGVVATGTGTITGKYSQDASAVFRVPANSGTAFGKLTVSGTATLPGGALFDVVTGDATNCGGITAGTTLAAVIKAGTLSSTTYGTVTDDCTNLDFTAVTSGNQVNLIAQALGPTWSISGASGSNGALSCASPVSDGGIATCTGTPSAGYTLSGATASGTACGTVSVSGSTITSSPVTGDCTITASFAPIPWAITGASGSNGALSCASPVTTGGTATCTGTPSAGYTLSGATRSGTACGTVSVSGNTVTSSPITGDCTITASFAAAPTWAVSGTSGGNGTLSCASPVITGGAATCTATPAAGYTLSGATASGTACGTVSVSGNTVTSSPVTGACTINASFAPIAWTVTGASGGNGTLSCSSPVTTSGTATCTATPAAGYTLSGATASGTACGTVSVSGNTVTSSPITGACSINASFALEQRTVSGSTSGNGAVSCGGAVTNGGTVSCTATASPGFVLSGATGSGPGCGTVSVSGNAIIAGPITGPCTITATFAAEPPPQPIPTLSQWGVAFLASLLAFFGLRRGGRIGKPQR